MAVLRGGDKLLCHTQVRSINPGDVVRVYAVDDQGNALARRHGTDQIDVQVTPDDRESYTTLT